MSSFISESKMKVKAKVKAKPKVASIVQKNTDDNNVVEDCKGKLSDKSTDGKSLKQPPAVIILPNSTFATSKINNNKVIKKLSPLPRKTILKGTRIQPKKIKAELKTLKYFNSNTTSQQLTPNLGKDTLNKKQECDEAEIKALSSTNTNQVKLDVEFLGKKFGMKMKNPNILGLTEALWNDIFGYLNFDDLKNFRLTSVKANILVENSLMWAINACFLYDEMFESKMEDGKMPPQLLCEDETLGWPNIRLKHVFSPFSTELFWPNNNVRESILSIEIKDCLVSWKDLMELLLSCHKLSEFSYILSVKFLSANDVYTMLKDNLDDTYDISTTAHQVKAYEDFQNSSSQNTGGKISIPLKKVYLEGLNLEITNIVLALLETLCFSEVQQLQVILSEKLFLKSHHQCTSYESSKRLRARRLINNNETTLQLLQISFLAEITGRAQTELADMFGVQTPSYRFFRHLYYPEYEKLSLKELIIEVPTMVTFPSTGNMKSLTEWFQPFIPDSESEALGQYFFLTPEFFCSQRKLQRFKFTRLDCPNIPDFSGLVQYLKKAEKCMIEIGIKAFFTQDKLNVIHLWETSKELLLDVSIVYGEEITVPLNFIIGEEMAMMDKTKKLELLSEVKGLESFNVPLLACKFPNLTHLTLGDLTVPLEGYSKSPKLNDKDFQTILEHLSQLVELVLKCNMSQLSDFGLTGISSSACQRMRIENSFKRKPGDVLGYSLSNLKSLEVFEIHGVSDQVTNVSAYLAFKDLRCLQELYLYSPKFSKLSKKFLKEKFSLRSNFQIEIH